VALAVAITRLIDIAPPTQGLTPFLTARCRLGSIATAAGQGKPVLEAFSHHEQIRVALSNDTLAETAKHDDSGDD
jgi:hypothetical protein